MNAADGAVPVDAAPRTTDELIARLSRHAATAADRLAGPFQPNPAQGIGFIDAIAVDDIGLTWVIGWIMDDAVFDRPLIIVDEVPHAAGFACALTERGDVPSGGRGFVGVMDTQWQASTSARPRFLLADDSGRYLEAVAPTPIRTKRAIAPVAREMLDRFVAGHGVLLRELFQTVHSWEIPDEAGSGDAVFVDEVAILPGFGALVTGWALSPSKLSDRFTLKAGNRIIAADELSVARFARPDLAHLHGDITLALARAGFTATFRGDLSEVRLNEMVLKGGWADGSSTNVAVPPESVRLLGVTVPIDHALAHYPALEAERFFPDFAHHAAIAARDRATTFSTYEAQPVAAALIMALPAATSDLFLMVDGALRNAAVLPADWGIVLIGCPDGVRSLLVSLFADLKRVTGRRCSLFLTPPGDTTNDVVSGVIEALGLARFAFVSADALLADRGWTALGGPLEPFALLEVRDAAADGTVEGTAGLNAFVCDAETWRRIASSASPRIGGVALDAAIALGFSPQQVVPDAALALGIRRPSALLTAINDCGVTANV